MFLCAVINSKADDLVGWSGYSLAS